jgi:hypothetical protein
MSGSSMNYVTAKYDNTNTQTQANSNECDTGTNCAITSPQTQGDGTANSPTNLQISKFNEDLEDGVGGGLDCQEPECAFIIVTKHVICPEGFVCPSAKDFPIFIHDPDYRFPAVRYSPDEFDGSETGTIVKVEFIEVYRDTDEFVGAYSVIELPLVPAPPGLILHSTREGHCGGPGFSPSVFIFPGETKRCTITNEYRVAPTP